MTYFSLVQRNRGHKGEAGWRETNKTTPEDTSSGYGGQEAIVRLSSTFIVQPNKPSWVSICPFVESQCMFTGFWWSACGHIQLPGCGSLHNHLSQSVEKKNSVTNIFLQKRFDKRKSLHVCK